MLASSGASPNSRSDHDEKIVRFEALRARFSAASLVSSPLPAATWQTGCEAFDSATGGIRRGVLSEFSGSLGCGALVLGALLEITVRERMQAALVDAADAWNPGDWSRAVRERILWVRCENATQAVRSVDLLLRDGNLPLVILDLQSTPVALLKKIPASTWHRLQRVVATADLACVVMTAFPMVEAARVRMITKTRWPLDAMNQRREVLQSRMTIEMREKFHATPVHASRLSA